MTVRSTAFVALLTLAACAPIRYEESAPLEKPTAAPSAYGLPLPDSPPMREPHTSYHRILAETGSGREVVGYALRYDALPPHKLGLERGYPTGTVFLEDREFNRVGFLTSLGRGYRYLGGKTEEVGQGTIEYLLPHFFDGTAFQVAAIE